MMLGLYQPDAPGWMPDLHNVEFHIGRKADIVNWFHNTNMPYRSDHVQSVLNHGAIPMLTWQPKTWNFRSALNGAYDKEIRAFGNAIKQHNPEILYIRFAHEMNGDWYPWCVDPGLYRAVWERTRFIIMNRAPWVQFVWCPNKDYSGAGRLIDYWPGSHTVDVVGIDGYNNPDFTGQARSASDIFDDTVRQIRSFWHGEIWICETGSVPHERRQWLRGMGTWARRRDVGAVCYFNKVGSGNYVLSADELAELGNVIK